MCSKQLGNNKILTTSVFLLVELAVTKELVSRSDVSIKVTRVNVVKIVDGRIHAMTLNQLTKGSDLTFEYTAKMLLKDLTLLNIGRSRLARTVTDSQAFW